MSTILEQLIEAPGRRKEIEIFGILVEIREPSFKVSAQFANGFESATPDENDSRFEYDTDLGRMAKLVADVVFDPCTNSPIFRSVEEVKRLKSSYVLRMFEVSVALMNSSDAPVQAADIVEGKERGAGDVPEITSET